MNIITSKQIKLLKKGIPFYCNIRELKDYSVEITTYILAKK